MARGQCSSIAGRLKQVVDDIHAGPDSTDAELLDRFVAHHDEAAFAALVRRHGALVLRVGRNVLRHQPDAEDAFQATFLVLARKATSIRQHNSLASWLHGVAFRTAMRIRKSSMRRRLHEIHAASRSPASPLTAAALQELQAILDEEVERLPERYRAAFVLCCLDNRTRAEAARELGCKEGTVCSRLAKARSMLQERLARRGVMLSAVLCAGAFSHGTQAATVPATLVALLGRNAPAFRAGKSLASSSSWPSAVAKAVLQEMGFARAKAALVLAGLLAVFGAATAVIFCQASGGSRAAAVGAPAPAAATSKMIEVRETRQDALGDPLPERALVRIGTTRLQHAGSVQAVAASADGRLLAACGGGDRLVRLWDASNGKPLRQFELSHWGPWALAFSPDGKELAAVSRSAPGQQAHGDFCRWDLATGRLLQKDTHHPGTFDSLVVHTALVARAGQGYLVAESAAADIVLYSPGIPQSARTLPGKADRVMSVAFLRDGQTLISLGDDGKIRFWNVATGKEIASVPVPSMKDHSLKGNCATIAVSDDGKNLALSLPDGSTRLLDGTGKELHRVPAPEAVQALAFAANGKSLLTGGQLVQSWDVATGKEIAIVRQGRSPIQGLTLSSDGKTVAFNARPNEVHVADLAGTMLFSGKTPCQGGIAFSTDGKHLAVAPGDRTIALWDVVQLRSGGEGKAFLGQPAAVLACQAEVQAFAFAPDGKRLATGEKGGFARIYDIVTKKQLLSLKPPGRTVFAVTFSPDAQLLATMGEQASGLHHVRDQQDMDMTSQVVRLWDSKSGKEVTTARELRLTGHTVAFHPNGRGLAALHLPAVAKLPPSGGFKDLNGPPLSVEERMETVRLWDIVSAHEMLRDDPVRRKVAEQATSWIIGRSSTEPCAFSPDGRLFAVPGPGVIVLFETASGKPRLRLGGHLQNVTGLAFTPDGKTLISASGDSTLLIWDVTGLRTVGKLSAKVEQLWLMLGGADAQKAGQALWAMVDAPTASLKFLRKHLQRVPANQDEVQKLIADLDDPKFTVREKATRELGQMGPAAEAALTAKLGARLSLETSKRIEKVLAVIRSTPPTPELMRVLRAVEMLEAIGGLDARIFLEDLASGASGALLTIHSNDALARMKR
jgi:RNA polymerase sigma factor (sigma-70 family)